MLKAKVRRVRDGEVTLEIDVETARELRHLEGEEVEVDIKPPKARFAIGERVIYSPILGRPENIETRVIDGPFIVGDSLCWKVEKVRGPVADRNLQPAVAKE